MADPYVGEIRIFSGNFAPSGWARCNGQLLPISQNPTLFSVLGTNYGGNGTTTFALPNLRNSAPINHGQGPGLTNRTIGEAVGSQSVALLTSEIPAHTHSMLIGNDNESTSAMPTNNALNRATVGNPYAPQSANPPLGALAPQAVTFAGGNLPHNNMMPFLALNFIIALQGNVPQ
ncbi:MAG TPA: tail fiber protein [Pyrinomonadaceae bacterium]|jgi:microcystin-dependent protein